jgi:hypothetical protein
MHACMAGMGPELRVSLGTNAGRARVQRGQNTLCIWTARTCEEQAFRTKG